MNHDKNSEDKGQTDQPTDQPIKAGISIPQNVVMDTSTGLTLPQTLPKAQKKTTETEWPNQTQDQTTLQDLDMEKATKTRESGTKMRTLRERKWKSILFIDVVI